MTITPILLPRARDDAYMHDASKKSRRADDGHQFPRVPFQDAPARLRVMRTSPRLLNFWFLFLFLPLNADSYVHAAFVATMMTMTAFHVSKFKMPRDEGLQIRHSH